MKKIGIIVIVALAAMLVFLFNRSIFDFSKQLNEAKTVAERSLIESIKEEIEKEILTPPPLRAKEEREQSILTQGGVLNWTNIHRNNNSLSSLKLNPSLSQAALFKANDMLQGQYFEHVSPSGKGPDFWVSGVGYEYITIGENLALGNFADDKELVQAWMDSPGHRANILSNRFTEIGIAVVRGSFEGRQTWIAVQTFGLPLSSCPEPDQALKSQIDIFDVQLKSLEVKLADLKAKIEQTNKRNPEYNQLVEEYNSLVNQYNSIIAQYKILIGQYNNQVAEFNKCLAG
ncbi:MAG: CAP domain-containing protein [bacterium]|nr:CAP domain-containing protein [bacterium]